MEKLTIRYTMRACPFCGSTADLIAVQEPGIETLEASSAIRFNNKAGCERCGIYFRRRSICRFEDGGVNYAVNGLAECVGLWNKRED